MDNTNKLLYKEVALCNFYLSAIEDKLVNLEEDESGSLSTAMQLIRSLRDAINSAIHFNYRQDKNISGSF